MNYFKSILLLLIVHISQAAISEERRISIFTLIEPIENIEVPPHVVSYNAVEIDFLNLRDFPESIDFELPNGAIVNLNTKKFVPRQGYLWRDEEEDPPGPPIYVDPNARLDEMEYFWTGANENYEASFTVRGKYIYGFVLYEGKKYILQSKGANRPTRFYEVNPEGLRPTGETDIRPGQKTINETNELSIDESLIQLGEVKKHNALNNADINNTRSSFPILLDTLIVFTDEARINLGGDPNIQSDDSGIQALIANSVDNLNIAFENSEVDVRVSAYYTTRLDNFPLTGGPLGYIAD